MHTVVVSAGEMLGALFPIVDPVGAVFTFSVLTASHTAQARVREAMTSAVLVFVVLTIFLFVGEPLLHHVGISFEALQIAGGIILGLFGLRMVMEEQVVAEPSPDGGSRIAFSPMAMPLLAGPGALGMVLGLESRVEEKTSSPALTLVGFVLGIGLVAVVTFACLATAGLLIRLFGRAGLDALERIFGLFVMAIGIEMVVYGIAHHSALA
jgi:multiple antibiotic resistance protein